ncbi:MAG TPA: competence protein CoiA family protein [Xanthobacteraceae bacterium]|nr:competence protein CoiA family protein [Xanthobacteraceae bacterium]
MKFALIERECREAQPGLLGKCRVCGDAMIAKCGVHRVWHWSHRGTRTCDAWWEPETTWHRGWKSQFPPECQEIIQWSKAGEKHIADVKTDRGVVVEFQHSFLPREEREAREMFYRNMVWVVDGLRRVQDRSRFFELLAKASIVKAKPLTFSLPLKKCALLRDWIDSSKPVFFDFGDNREPGDPLLFPASVLWRLEPRSPIGEAHLSPVLKTSFLDKYRKGLALKGIDYRMELRTAYAALLQQAAQYRRLTYFGQYMPKMRRTRRPF